MDRCVCNVGKGATCAGKDRLTLSSLVAFQVLARKELNYGRMDERDLKQLTEEVCVECSFCRSLPSRGLIMIQITSTHSNILETLGSNDNIVRYYERFVDKPNNMLYILMEYCAGGDLAGVIQRCRKTNCILPEDVVWAYLTQITLALHDCHSETDAKGNKKPVILHRDIKPENGETLLLCDFFSLWRDYSPCMLNHDRAKQSSSMSETTSSSGTLV